MLIHNPPYAPVRVTSVQLIHGAGTNEVRSEPPPGWGGGYRSRRDSVLGYTHNEDLEEGKDPGNCESSTLDLRDDSREIEHPDPAAPANSEPKKYDFSKRKIYNTPFTKYWIVHYGEPLQTPPPEIDASGCSGPAVFVNVPPEGERQIWLWDAGRNAWDAVSIKHVVDLDVKRQLNLNTKHVPVFVVPRAEREKGIAERSQFVQYLATLP